MVVGRAKNKTRAEWSLSEQPIGHHRKDMDKENVCPGFWALKGDIFTYFWARWAPHIESDGILFEIKNWIKKNCFNVLKNQVLVDWCRDS